MSGLMMKKETMIMIPTCIRPHYKCRCCSSEVHCSQKVLHPLPQPGFRNHLGNVEPCLRLEEADLSRHSHPVQVDTQAHRQHIQVCRCSRSFQGCLCTGGAAMLSSFNLSSMSNWHHQLHRPCLHCDGDYKTDMCKE